MWKPCLERCERFWANDSLKFQTPRLRPALAGLRRAGKLQGNSKLQAPMCTSFLPLFHASGGEGRGEEVEIFRTFDQQPLSLALSPHLRGEGIGKLRKFSKSSSDAHPPCLEFGAWDLEFLIPFHRSLN